MNLFKNYEKEFEDLQKEITTLSEKIHDNKELIKLADISGDVKCIIKQNEQIEEELAEIKQLLIREMGQKPIDGVDSECVLKYKKGKHISQFSDFKRFATPRYYDLNGQYFYLIGKDGVKNKIQLSFQQLVAIINGHTNNLSVKKMRQTNPILNNFSEGNLHQFIYYWRAGSFNQTIIDNARKLGFNPDKLISHECDDL